MLWHKTYPVFCAEATRLAETHLLMRYSKRLESACFTCVASTSAWGAAQKAAQQARLQPLARAVLGGAAKAEAEEFVFTRSAARRSELRRLRQLLRAASMRATDALRQVMYDLQLRAAT